MGRRGRRRLRDPEARACEVVGDPGLCGDAGQHTDIDDGFRCDDPVEAAVKELVEESSAVSVDAVEYRTGRGLCRFVQCGEQVLVVSWCSLSHGTPFVTVSEYGAGPGHFPRERGNPGGATVSKCKHTND